VRRLGPVAASAAMLCVAAAAAEPATEEAVRFRYEAPPDCPAAPAFTARVRERTTRGREAEPGELARTFAVSIRPDGAGFFGKIEFLDDAGAPVSRGVHGEECDAVVDSLALITALALDATLREDQEPVEPAAAPRAVPSARAAARPAPAGLAPAPPPSPPRPSVPLVQNVRVGVSAAYHSLIPAPSFGLLGQADLRGSFSVRLTAHHESSTIQVDQGREVSVRILGLAASVCALRPHWREIAFYPCLWFDVGSLRARGVSSDALPSVSSETVPWVAVGPELRLSWEPRAPFWLELRGVVPVALYRHRFELQIPYDIALNVEHDLSFEGGAVAGVRFW
jgi:hypothetical protein